ncbi:MAG: hypothetical protein AB8B04_09605, partial [Prochlorococcus sp.]
LAQSLSYTQFIYKHLLTISNRILFIAKHIQQVQYKAKEINENPRYKTTISMDILIDALLAF